MGIGNTVSIAVVGGGLGGAATAALLQCAGYEVTVFEQTSTFEPAGAGIHLTPNVMRILRHIGIDDDLIAAGNMPESFTSRSLASNKIRFSLALGGRAESAYGAPYLTLGRGKLHQSLINAVSPGSVQYGKRLVGVDQRPGGVKLFFEDGAVGEATCVVGADGLGSHVRESLHGVGRPDFAGQVAYRAIISDASRTDVDRRCITKWWADDKFVIAYPIDSRGEAYYFVAGVAAGAWEYPVSWVDGDKAEMLAAFAGSCEEVLGLLDRGTSLSKWPLFERPSLQQWGRGRVALLGDACHPMRPHMAQGAAMAIEDAAVLLRCLESEEDIEDAFWRYASSRRRRTSQIQAVSAENTWLKNPEDPAWVFGYDALTAPLALPRSNATTPHDGPLNNLGVLSDVRH